MPLRKSITNFLDSKMVKQFSGLVGLRVLAIGLTFIQSIVLTRTFGAESFGIFSVSLSTMIILSLVVSFGFDQVLLKELAAVGWNAAAKNTRWKHVFSFSRTFVGLMAVTVTTMALALVLLTEHSGVYQFSLVVILAGLPVLIARKFAQSLAQGAKKIARSIIGSQVVHPLMMILGAILVIIFSLRHSAETISIIYIFALLVSFLVSGILARPVILRVWSRPRSGAADTSISNVELIRSGANFALGSTAIIVCQHIDVMLTGLLANPEQAAIVRICSRVAELVAIARAIAVIQFKPYVAEAWAQGNLNQLRSLNNKMAAIFLATGTPLVVITLLFSTEILGIFGEEFTEATMPLAFYVFGIFFTMLTGPSNMILAMTGHESKVARVLWISVFINLILDVLLIPKYGPLGCAIANCTSLAVAGTMSSLLAWKVLKINTTFTCLFHLVHR